MFNAPKQNQAALVGGTIGRVGALSTLWREDVRVHIEVPETIMECQLKRRYALLTLIVFRGPVAS
jgi:hypothetical protein